MSLKFKNVLTKSEKCVNIWLAVEVVVTCCLLQNASSLLFAGVAQLVEQLIRNQQVAGSSPATSSKKYRFSRGNRYFFVRNVLETSGSASGSTPDPHADPQDDRRGYYADGHKSTSPFGRRVGFKPLRDIDSRRGFFVYGETKFAAGREVLCQLSRFFSSHIL